ncbi:hypothetical protein [Streptomyces sp. DT224]|uniref:hypothetical protein n=1 Tax=Streptomyces sp. DT224 TaxID=3393426 RepID=UPI003CE6E116
MSTYPLDSSALLAMVTASTDTLKRSASRAELGNVLPGGYHRGFAIMLSTPS